MKHKYSITDILHNVMSKKSVEPVQRMVGGRFGYAFHRFPIKGGISNADVMLENIQKNNTLLRRLQERGK